jgi:hypothetical protein
MRRSLALALLLVVGWVGVATADHAREQSERLDEILRLAEEGVSDDVIIKHIAASDFVFELTADDILELRGLGLSDPVLEALLDTAIDDERARRRSRRSYLDDEPNVYLSLSAGYFSPWYWYPYAWGFYYDPFPACYSLYYYPFHWGRPWGWYGACDNYYYPRHWRGWRWDDHRYYDTWARRSQTATVRVPRLTPRRQHGSSTSLAERQGRIADPPSRTSVRRRGVDATRPEPRRRSQGLQVPDSRTRRSGQEAAPPETRTRRRSADPSPAPQREPSRRRYDLPGARRIDPPSRAPDPGVRAPRSQSRSYAPPAAPRSRAPQAAPPMRPGAGVRAPAAPRAAPASPPSGGTRTRARH